MGGFGSGRHGGTVTAACSRGGDAAQRGWLISMGAASGSRSGSISPIRLMPSSNCPTRHAMRARATGSCETAFGWSIPCRPMAGDAGGFNARGLAAERQSCSCQMADGISGAARPTDQVAYIRFTSDYRNFREAKDLGEFLGRIEHYMFCESPAAPAQAVTTKEQVSP